MKKVYRDIVISAIPAIVFVLIYTYMSFVYAVLIGFGIGIIIYSLKYSKERKLSTLNYIGIFGLIFQTIISLLAENQMTYFIYPIISNVVYACAFGISLLIKRDLISVIGKNTCETEEIYTILRPVFRKLTIIWFTFFSLKTIIKFVGLTSLSFETLFIVNWILGTPISIVLFWFTYWYPVKYYIKSKRNRPSDRLFGE